MSIRNILTFVLHGIIIVVCVAANFAYGQDISHIEKKELTKDTMVIRAMHTRLTQIWHKHPDSLKSVGDYIVRSSQAINYTAGEILGLQDIGTGQGQMGQYKDAVATQQKVIEKAEKINNKPNWINALSNQSMAYTALGMYDRSIDNLTKAMSLSDEKKDGKLLIHILNNLGMVYNYKGDLDKALDYYEKCREMMFVQQDSTNLSFVYGNIANILLSRREVKKATDYYNRSLRLAKQFDNQKGIGYALKSLGSIALNQEKPQEALTFFMAAKDIFEKSGEKTEYLPLLEYLSDTYYELHDNKLGLSYLKQAFDLAKEQEQLYYIKVISLKLGTRYEETGNLTEALKMQRISTEATDSLSSKDMKEKIVRIEERYQFEKELQLTDQLHKKQIEQREFILILIILLSVFGVATTFFVIQAYYRQKRNNKTLREAKAVIESKHVMLLSEDQFKDHMISVLAHDIRSPIIAVRSLLDNFNTYKLGQKQFDDYLRFTTKEIDNLTNFIEDILLWVKTKKSNFNQAPTRFDIAALIDETIAVYQLKASQKAILVKQEYPTQRYVMGNEDILKIILRNLLDNAIKYCDNQDTIRIQVLDDDLSGKVKVSITDSGPGLPTAIMDSLHDQMAHKNSISTSVIGAGLGLNMCLYYAQLIDSNMEVYSEKGKGTRFSFFLYKSEG